MRTIQKIPFFTCLLAALAALAVSAKTFADFTIEKEVFSFVEAQYGKEAVSRIKGWESLVRHEFMEKSLEKTSLKRANDYFNQVRWLSDFDHWGVEDYWATPVETLASNGGDCEDFSIGKYFSLIESEFDPAKLRITYVKSLTHNQAHMVLAYYDTPSAEPLILDNINKQVLPASQRTDLLPIYSFNGESIWLAKDRGRKLKGNSQVSLPKWREVNQRLLKELR